MGRLAWWSEKGSLLPLPGRAARRRLGSGYVLVCGALLASLILAACGGGGATPGKPQAAGTGSAGAGAQGQPVELTVGYQPYYTGGWSALPVKHQELWKQYLPPGSTVTWEVGLQGAIITNNMLAGKFQLGYVGDMPGLVATTKRDQADIRLVAVGGWTNQQCNIFVVRADAPQFNSPQEALRWMDGRKVAVPKGSCTDRFAQQVFDREGVRPSEYLNQSIEVITTNLRAGNLDAAVIWEPTVTRVGSLLGEKTARVVATGAYWGIPDASVLAVRKDFLDQRPDVVVGWLKAEIEAQRFIISNYPQNACQVSDYALRDTTGYEKRQLWYSLYGLLPLEKSKEDGIRYEARLVFDDATRALFKQSSDFLLNAKVINSPMPDDAIVTAPLEQAMRELGVTAPLGSVPRFAAEEYPCG